ncbi:hypothetical protein IAT38_007022 [Cryptococcus sp. DSM 104549]
MALQGHPSLPPRPVAISGSASPAAPAPRAPPVPIPSIPARPATSFGSALLAPKDAPAPLPSLPSLPARPGFRCSGAFPFRNVAQLPHPSLPPRPDTRFCGAVPAADSPAPGPAALPPTPFSGPHSLPSPLHHPTPPSPARAKTHARGPAYKRRAKEKLRQHRASALPTPKRKPTRRGTHVRGGKFVRTKKEIRRFLRVRGASLSPDTVHRLGLTLAALGGFRFVEPHPDVDPEDVKLFLSRKGEAKAPTKGQEAVEGMTERILDAGLDFELVSGPGVCFKHQPPSTTRHAGPQHSYEDGAFHIGCIASYHDLPYLTKDATQTPRKKMNTPSDAQAAKRQAIFEFIRLLHEVVYSRARTVLQQILPLLGAEAKKRWNASADAVAASFEDLVERGGFPKGDIDPDMLHAQGLISATAVGLGEASKPHLDKRDADNPSFIFQLSGAPGVTRLLQCGVDLQHAVGDLLIIPTSQYLHYSVSGEYVSGGESEPRLCGVGYTDRKTCKLGADLLREHVKSEQAAGGGPCPNRVPVGYVQIDFDGKPVMAESGSGYEGGVDLGEETLGSAVGAGVGGDGAAEGSGMAEAVESTFGSGRYPRRRRV